MKQSDTQLGKAYIKAKESSPPPPPPPGKKSPAPPPPPAAKDKAYVYHEDDSQDVASRRYEKIQSFIVGAEFGMQATYDKVKDQIMYQVYDQKTQKRTKIKPFTNTEDAIRKVVLDAVKIKRGQSVTDGELTKIKFFTDSLAKFAAEHKSTPKYDA